MAAGDDERWSFTIGTQGDLAGAAQFNEAVQNLGSTVADPELRGGDPELSPLGVPMPYAGNFADVYKVHCAATGNTWAVKFFKREVRDLRDRYRAISQHLAAARLPFMTEFEYQEQGVRIGGAWFPLVKMRWIEGQILSRYVSHSLDQPKRLDQLFQLWIQLADRLRGAGIAHADLQHGNVVLVPYGDQGRLLLKLIDYDGMFVPSLAGRGSGELGHANYQHPQRARTQAFHEELDRFSHLAICTALRCLSVGGLPLWDRFNNGENLLFTAQDFAEPARSPLFRELWTLRRPDVHALVGQLVIATQRPLEQTPLLAELVDQGGVRPLSPLEQQQVEAVLHGQPMPQAPATPILVPMQPPAPQQLVSCPRCSGQVALPPNVSYNIPVACPLCGQSYFLAEAMLVPMQQPILQPLPTPFPPQLPPDPFASAPPGWPPLAAPPARSPGQTQWRTIVRVAVILLVLIVGGSLLWWGGSKLVAWATTPPIPTNPAEAAREASDTIPKFMAAMARQDEAEAAKHLARLEQLNGHPMPMPVEQWRQQLQTLRTNLARRPATNTTNPNTKNTPATQNAGKPLTGPVDLLATFRQPEGDFGPVSRIGGRLSIRPRGASILNNTTFAHDLPNDYELEMRVTPREGQGNGLLVSIPVKGKTCLITVDGYLGEPPSGKIRTGLETIDGWRTHDRNYPGKPYEGDVLRPGMESVLSVRVSGGDITLTCDGKQILSWTGDPSRLGIYGMFDQHQPSRVSLGTWKSHYEFSSVMLKPLGGSSKTGSLGAAETVAFPKLPAGAGPIDADAPKTFTTTSSGLKYRILRKGTGRSPVVNDMVELHSMAWLEEGKILPGSSTYPSSTRIHPVNSPVPPGFTEGLCLVKLGGMIELAVGPEVNGNQRLPPSVPPGATIHYIVEVLAFK